MRALSVRAPWWWAILHGKPVENRDWPTRVRGRILIHASKWWKWNEAHSDWGSIDMMQLADKRDGILKDWMPIPDMYDTRMALEDIHSYGGLIVGSVEIVDCVTTHPSAFFQGRYGFVLRDPVTFNTPIPFKGALG